MVVSERGSTNRNRKAVFQLEVTMDWRMRCLFAVTVCWSVGLGRIVYRLSESGSAGKGINVFLDMILLCIGCIVLDVYSLRPAASHTFRTIVFQYLILRISSFAGMLSKLFSFDPASRNVQQCQQKLLRSIIRANAKTSYSKDHNLSEVDSMDTFRTKQSLTSHASYQPYIAQIVDENKSNVLFPGPADYIAMTTGTTSGKSKMFPKSTKLVRKTWTPIMMVFQTSMIKIPRYKCLKKLISVRICPRFTYTKHGIKRGPISGMIDDPLQILTPSPAEGYNISLEHEAIYIHVLFGISEPEVGHLSFQMAPVAVDFFKTLENEWVSLCQDLERGEISSILELTVDMADAINKSLRAIPHRIRRAEFLRSEFKKGFENIVPRIWPSCAVASAIGTGGFKVQYEYVRDRYMGAVPVVSLMHTGTETIYGFTLNPLDSDIIYTIAPQLNIYEFIPLANTEEIQPRTCLAHEVEVGKVYEMVVTTVDGLYRYRTEDLVEITGFHVTLPQYRFVQRAGDILNVYTEKLPEVVLSKALLEAAKTWRSGTITSYTSVENFHVEKITGKLSGSLFYIVFLELSDNTPLTGQESEEVDVKLRSLAEYYDVFRKKGTIQSLHIYQVRRGTFDGLKSRILTENVNAHPLQYKSPRIVRSPERLSYLLAEIIKK